MDDRLEDRLGEPESTPGWFPDPTGRFDHRWFNGVRWTTDVSVDGQRYIDPQPWAPPLASASAPRRQRSTMAVLAFIFGLLSVALGWMPFLFVIAAGGAITALVLGTIVLRRQRIAPSGGRGLAIAGVALAPAGLALCIVGFLLTRTAVREFEDYLSPGAFTVAETTCRAADDGLATFAGTIANGDDRTHDYILSIEYVDAGSVVKRVSLTVTGVAPGDTAEWTDRRFVGDVELDCHVRSVNGPFPFGLDPNR